MTEPTGVGKAPGHHGEILQGAFESAGRLVRALVTLPYNAARTEVQARLSPTTAPIVVTPSWKTKAAKAARLTLDAIDRNCHSATLTIRSSLPVSRGFGSSTSDVTATIDAVLNAAGVNLSAPERASLAVQAEIASDPLMFDRVTLFAHREGRLLEDFETPFPQIAVLGLSTSSDGTGVDTLKHPPARYSAEELHWLRGLRTALRNALQSEDVEGIAWVASMSAQINQRHLPVPRFNSLLRLVENTPALGIQVAHSGDIAGLLFPADTAPEVLAGVRVQLAQLGIAETWIHVVSDKSSEPATAADVSNEAA